MHKQSFLLKLIYIMVCDWLIKNKWVEICVVDKVN